MESSAERVVDAVNRFVLATMPSCRQIARELRLTTTDLQILHQIYLQRNPTTASMLRSMSGLPSSTMTRILDRLEEGGFICRFADPDDRRIRLIKTVPDRLEPIISHFDSSRRALEAGLSTCSDRTLDRMSELFGGRDEIPLLPLRAGQSHPKH